MKRQGPLDAVSFNRNPDAKLPRKATGSKTGVIGLIQMAPTPQIVEKLVLRGEAFANASPRTKRRIKQQAQARIATLGARKKG